MLLQSSASSLLHWSYAHWLKRVASVLSDVPLSVATLWAESWALIRVLRSALLRHVASTWLLSPPLARATNDRPAVMFQPSDSYTCTLYRYINFDVYRRAEHTARNISLASFSSEVSDASLSQLVVHTCQPCMVLPSTVSLAGQGAEPVVRTPRIYVSEISKPF